MLRGQNLKLTEDPHRRLNALTNEWVLVSPHRTTPSLAREVAKLNTTPEPAYDPNCYLCPGNARAGGVRNPKYETTFVFENDFAALKPQTARDRLDVENKGLLVAETEAGLCRVICFSPRHDLTLATMSPEAIEIVVHTWMGQFRELGGLDNINHVQIFENRGAMMGASNPHPHCQVWATASIPQEPAKELQRQRSYLKSHGSCLLCDYVALEARQQVRIVCENEGFVAMVPFWAVWPFETAGVQPAAYRQHERFHSRRRALPQRYSSSCDLNLRQSLRRSFPLLHGISPVAVRWRATSGMAFSCALLSAVAAFGDDSKVYGRL